MQTKEAIYDTKIFPLMREILETCKAHKIAMVASFDLRDEPTDDLYCTSVLLADEYNPPREFLRVRDILYPRTEAFAITVTKAEPSHGG